MCGDGKSSKIRHRRILRVSLYGGEKCPAEADSDGECGVYEGYIIGRDVR